MIRQTKALLLRPDAINMLRWPMPPCMIYTEQHTLKVAISENDEGAYIKMYGAIV